MGEERSLLLESLGLTGIGQRPEALVPCRRQPLGDEQRSPGERPVPELCVLGAPSVEAGIEPTEFEDGLPPYPEVPTGHHAEEVGLGSCERIGPLQMELDPLGPLLAPSGEQLV